MKLNFLGDVYIDKEYEIKFQLDDFIFNLEYPLSTEGLPAKNKVNLGIDSKHYIQNTFKKNPLAVNLANNHIMDYGEDAFNETLEFLEKENIKFFGAGTTENNFYNPCLLKLEDKIIALYGYCCSSTNPVIGSRFNNGAAPLDLSLIEKDLNKQSETHIDYKIVNLHWGEEEIKYPKPSDILKAKKIIDLGADMIIGHHAHIIQSRQVYKTKNIYYGLGNFLFPNLNVPQNHTGKKFLSRYIKEQSKHNRYSILISLNKNLKTNEYITFFDNKCVSLTNKKMLFNRVINKEKPYKLYVQYSRKKGTALRFIKNPKIPSIQQIKTFLGINK